MPYYREMPLSDIRSWLMCLRAALGDAGLTLVIFMTGGLIFRSWCWPDRLSAGKIGYLVLSGSLIGVLIEIFALSDNRWEYSSSMLVIPWLGVGAVPFIQMICLPCLSFIVSAKIYPCRKKPGSAA